MSALPRTLHGRRHECATLDRLLATVRAGESRSIVLSGVPGIGKSALLDYVAEQAKGFRVERAVGIESEQELAFAGLHLLCLPMLDQLDRLPAPQSAALSTAFGLSAGTPPDRFLVGIAVLSLFSLVAEQRPLVALVDDAQWLDEVSAQVLAFVARRLRAESVALVIAARSGAPKHPALLGLPELQLSRLRDDDARALLDSVIRWPIDPAVRDRLIADARGCPLALIELPNGLSAAELAGGFGLPDTAPLMTVLEETYLSRASSLPSATRTLLLVAALDPTGDLALVWRAAEQLGIGGDAAEAAEASGLVELSGRVRFRHPLVRSAVSRMARRDETREVHRALADATAPGLDPDRRAWHLALAAAGPDESVAVELERSAGRAEERGGLAAAAAFLKAAVDLTRDPARRGERAVTAAEAEYRAGASDAALALVDVAEATPLDERTVARAQLLRGQIAFFSRRGREAPPLLLAAAERWRPLDRDVSRAAYLDAISAALVVGRFAEGVGVLDVARAVLGAPTSTGQPADLLLEGFATIFTEGYAAGAPLLKRAVSAFREERSPSSEALRRVWLATHAARDLWDDESWEVLSTRHVGIARSSGALSVLPIALTARIGLHVAAGEISSAVQLVEESAEVTAATGRTTPPYGAIAVAAWRGLETGFSRMRQSAVEEAAARGDGLGAAILDYAGAVLSNSRGEYRRALAQAESGASHPHDLCYAMWSLAELVEAASRSDEPARAAAAVERLSESTQASGTDWALGIEARSRALIADREAAEAWYREAIDRLAATRVRMELARSHLLFGEWLRRAGRRVDAREQLRVAHEMFLGFGAGALAERARRELSATGETARRRTITAERDLTAQEAQIAALAASGRTNSEIGAELFISARTVEWHLRKVYPKLGVGSRRELGDALDLAPSTGRA